MEDNKSMSWLMDKVVYELHNNGIEFNTVDYGNGYYIFDFGENSVCHFTVKGLKKWRWGIWCTEYEDDKYKISLFGEHEYYLDKFKPTQTAVSYTFKYEDDESIHKWVVAFAYRIGKIAKHPLREEYKIYTESSYIRPRSFIRYHLGNFWYYKVKKPISDFHDTTLALFWLKIVSRIYELRWKRRGNGFHVNVHDRGDGWHPRFEFQVVYGNLDEDETFDVYHSMRKEARSQYGYDYNRPWLFTEDMWHNTSFIDAESDKDLRGFRYKDENEDENE